MPEKSLLTDVPLWIQNSIAAIIGALSAVILAMLNRGPALDVMINTRLSALLSADSERIASMSETMDKSIREMAKLRASVDTLTQHVSSLEEILVRNGLSVPPRPAFLTMMNGDHDG